MAYNEQTSEPIGSIATRYSRHLDPNVRRMAMSLLTQRPDHKTPKMERLLNELVRVLSGRPGTFDAAIQELALEEVLRNLRRPGPLITIRPRQPTIAEGGNAMAMGLLPRRG
jgi:hypothetical protein